MRFIDPPGGRPWALIGLCGASLVLNAALLLRIALGDAAAEPELSAVALPEPVATVAVAEVGTVAEHTAELEAAPVDEGPAVEIPDGIDIVKASVSHSLARTFQKAVPSEHADVVSAVYARNFVWDLDVRTDLQKGDEVAVAYVWDGELAHIPVATYHSKNLGRTLRAYQFPATGDHFASWWDEEGREMSRRLIDGPLVEYEQVTSLLKDRPRHKGMDFKTPVGTAIVSPRNGQVTRTDWNLAYNGNCIEVRYDDGVMARFLHLSSTDVKAGQRIGAGQQLGLTGNTGRSTAPHLHYELDRNGKVVDPVDYHGVERRALPSVDIAAFQDQRDRLQAMLDAR